MLLHTPTHTGMFRKSQLSSLYYYRVATLAVIVRFVAGPFLAVYYILNHSNINIDALHQRTILQSKKSLWNTRGFLEKLPYRADLASNFLAKPTGPQSPAGLDLTRKNVSDYLFEFVENYDQQCYLGRTSFTSSNIVMYSMSKRYDSSEGIITQYHGQICSADLSTGNLHVLLHPADAESAVKAGWGQVSLQHPLSAWWENLMSCGHDGRITMKLPNNEEELEVIKRIIDAAAWWVGGTDSKNVAASFV